MILALRTPAFDRVFNAVKQVVATDHLSESINMGVINDVVYELFRQCTERVNIVDVDPDYQSLYQPFYEALNELLLLHNVPVIAVSGLLVDGPDFWTIILVVDQRLMYTVGGSQHGV